MLKHRNESIPIFEKKKKKKQIQQGLCIERMCPSKCYYILPNVIVKGSLEDTVQNIFSVQYSNMIFPQ